MMERTDPATANGLDDGVAIADVFERHGQHVFRTAYRITGNVADAEDVLQTVFLKACERGRDDPDGHRFGAEPARYLARSAVNGALDVLRNRRSGHAADKWEFAQTPSVGRDAEEDAWRAELRGRLRAALATVAPNWAEMVALRYFEDLSNVEIATLLGTSASTVAVTLHRARGRLQAALGDLSDAFLQGGGNEQG